MKKIPLLLITVLLLFPPANAAVFQTKPLPEQFQELVPKQRHGCQAYTVDSNVISITVF